MIQAILFIELYYLSNCIKQFSYVFCANLSKEYGSQNFVNFIENVKSFVYRKACFNI